MMDAAVCSGNACPAPAALCQIVSKLVEAEVKRLTGV